MDMPIDPRGWLTGEQRRWLLDYVGSACEERPVDELHRMGDMTLINAFVEMEAWRFLGTQHHPVIYRALRSALAHPASVQVASLTPRAALATVEALDRLTDDPDVWLKHAYRHVAAAESRDREIDEPAVERL